MAKIKYTIRNHEVVLTTLTTPDSDIAKMAKFSPREGDYMPIFIDLYPRTRKLFWAYRHHECHPNTPNSFVYEASKITVHDLPGCFDYYVYIDKNQYDVIHYIVVPEGEMRNIIKALSPDSETEHTKDEFVARMRGKFTEQDITEAKQRTESCVASLSQFELPKQIEAQINKAMESIKAESRKQFGDFGAANADIAIPMYRQMMRLGALLALSAGDLESEQTDSDRGDYISMTKPTDPNK